MVLKGQPRCWELREKWEVKSAPTPTEDLHCELHTGPRARDKKQPNGSEHKRWSQTARSFFLPLPLTCCVTYDGLLNFSVPQLPHMENRENISIYLRGLLWRLLELVCIKMLRTVFATNRFSSVFSNSLKAGNGVHLLTLRMQSSSETTSEFQSASLPTGLHSNSLATHTDILPLLCSLPSTLPLPWPSAPGSPYIPDTQN